MTTNPTALNRPTESKHPLGMSKFSLRRYSVQHVFLLLAVLCLIISINVYALLKGGNLLLALSATTLFLALVMTGLVIFIGARTVAIEIWIRRLGMGDFEYHIKPWGNDEVSKACEALELLRRSSIRALQLDRVQQLSNELRDKNEELEVALADLRRSQDKIISQKKLAELGELSSGVAHEMRNPLHFIRNFADASLDIARELDEILKKPEEFRQCDALELVNDMTDNMERVLHHSGRANGIVSAMLTLDRGTGGGFRAVDLNKLVDEQTHVAYRAAKVQDPDLTAEITMELDPTLEEIDVIPEDMARVIASLVSNACHALILRARQSGNDYHPMLKIATSATEEEVTILVGDNGTGMTEETQEKIFNPFFTTKAGVRNTGLGLSLAYDVVREHGGNIKVDSELGHHTEMIVTLPKPADEQ